MTKLLKSTYYIASDAEGEKGEWGCEWEGNDKDEIIAFYCFGDSEENNGVITKIKEYKPGKDYILSHNQSSRHGFSHFNYKYDKYEILNSQLKEDLAKIMDEYSEEPEYEHLEHLKPLKPAGIDPIEPIEPIKPIRPIGKPKEDEKWKEYWKRMVDYAKRMEDYSRRVQEYNQKVIKQAQSILQKSRVNHNQKTPHKFDTQISNQQNTTKGSWNWLAFWTGMAVASLILGLVLVLVKLFRKKN